MKAWVGLGSNLGDRRANLERAAKLLLESSGVARLQAAPIVTSPALIPPGAPQDWNKPYLNSVIGLDWPGTASELLILLKKIEKEIGRTPAERWAPRLIDLDLLTLGEQSVNTDLLRLPHPGIKERSFVLTPLNHFASDLRLPTENVTVLQMRRRDSKPLPLWMGIVNLTPDSFSELSPMDRAQETLTKFAAEGVHIVDLGAESTRPGATSLTAAEEWTRLAPVLDWWSGHTETQVFKPLLSVDTYHAETAARAVAMGADIINDVSGLSSSAMLEVLCHTHCQYVLMHSLSVPADPSKHLSDNDPILELKNWALTKLEILQEAGVSRDRIVFDPGIGFGKTPAQCWQIVKGVHRLLDLPVRLMIGHSCKSFLTTLRDSSPSDRHSETLGLSLQLASRGVDILRVHEPIASQLAYQSYVEASP